MYFIFHNIGIMFLKYFIEIKSLILYEQLGEPPMTSPGFPSCDPHGNPPILGDCWYNCTSEDISGDDKKRRLRKVRYFLLLVCVDSLG